MDQNLNKAITFFNLDLKIKESLVDLKPTFQDNYNIRTKIKYIDNLLKSLKEIEEYFLIISNTCGVINKKEIKVFFNYIRTQLYNFNYKADLVDKIYQKCFFDMSPDLINETNKICVGYLCIKPIGQLISKCKTINELLHVVHSYLLNDENFYQNIPSLAEKENITKYPICLRGVESEFATLLYTNFPYDFDCGYTDILSLPNNKVLMMVRDAGHALTLEIDASGDKVFVKYFIPKVCNLEMSLKLKGLDKPGENPSWLKGSFESSKEDAIYDIITLIESVPQDKDMEIMKEYYR